MNALNSVTTIAKATKVCKEFIARHRQINNNLNCACHAHCQNK